MTSRFGAGSSLRRSMLVLLIVALATALALGLRPHAEKLLGAVRAMDARWLLPALGLCVLHRLVNSLGWTMVLWAMGRPLPARTGARIWLASEAFRWLPGSVWAYGSRGVLAARAGIPPAVAAASLIWELLITVLAWASVAALALGCWAGPIPPAIEAAGRSLVDRPWMSTLGVAAAALVAVLVGSKALGRKLSRLSESGASFRRFRVDGPGFLRVYSFHLAMVLANGGIFWLVLRAAPGGDRCTVAVALAANSIAWLAGLFAVFAPGGLVVREATIAVLLSGAMPPEQAFTVALAWRAVQVAAEVGGTLAILPGGPDRSPGEWTETRVLAKGIEA